MTGSAEAVLRLREQVLSTQQHTVCFDLIKHPALMQKKRNHSRTAYKKYDLQVSALQHIQYTKIVGRQIPTSKKNRERRHDRNQWIPQLSPWENQRPDRIQLISTV